MVEGAKNTLSLVVHLIYLFIFRLLLTLQSNTTVSDGPTLLKGTYS